MSLLFLTKSCFERKDKYTPKQGHLGETHDQDESTG